MPKTPDYFVGKTIVITGAASGIGRATALIFAREGANVVAADVNAEGAERTAGEVRELGAAAEAVATDVTSRAEVEAMIERGLARFDGIDFQFNCAGAALRRCGFLEIDDALWDTTQDLNLKSVFFGMQAVLPHMLERGKGVIVNVASMSHMSGAPGSTVGYAAAKGGVVSMTMGVAREFADRGIRCLSISPGPVRTNFQAAADSSPEFMRRALEAVPMQRFAEPEEMGELVLFMCSDSCEYMTADSVYVNGGGGWR